MEIRRQIHAIVTRSNMLIAVLSIVGITTAILFANSLIVPYWLAWLREPISISNENLTGLTGDTALYNYTVSGLYMLDTGFEELTINTDSDQVIRYDANLGLLLVGSQDFLLVRTFFNIDEDLLTYTGSIIPIPFDIQDEVVNVILEDLEDESITILPIMLETERNDLSWRIGTTVLILLGLLSLWGIIMLIYRRNPYKHPIFKRLARFGDPRTVIDSIERDSAIGVDSFGALFLTRNWAFIKSFTSFDAMSLSDTVWLYIRQESEKGLNAYTLHIHDKHGVSWAIPCKNAQAAEALEAIAAHEPQVIVGYSNQYRDIWQHSPKIFVDEIEHQRTEGKR